MSEEQMQELFVERISNVAHANGVFRITLGVNEDVNNVRPSVRLLVPANQLGPMLQGIANAAKNIGEQIQFKGDESPAETPKSAPKARSAATQSRRSTAKPKAKPASKSKAKK